MPEKDKRLTTQRLALVSTAGLSSKYWLKPVVTSVVLPAHAQTSHNTGAVITIGARTIIDPVIVEISDNDNAFEYSVQRRLISDSVSTLNTPPQPNVVSGRYVPPLDLGTATGNSGADTSVRLTYPRDIQQSDIEFEVNVTDKDGNQTQLIKQIATP